MESLIPIIIRLGWHYLKINIKDQFLNTFNFIAAISSTQTMK